MKKLWEQTEIDYLVNNYQTKTCEEIGKILNRTTRSVRHKFLELKLKRKQAKLGDIINGWQIIGTEQECHGTQLITYAIVKSVLGDEKISRYRLTLLTKGKVGWPDRRRPDVIIKNKQNCKTGGLRHHRLHSIWRGMLNRCYNNNQPNYINYGGRGIKICEEWKNNFLSFYNWSINNGYDDELSIDRIDNDKDYSPENCKWSTKRTQLANRRNSLIITAFGETKSADDWSLDERCKCSYNALWYRITKGWNHEKALTKPSKTVDNFRRYKSLYNFISKKYSKILDEFSGTGV